MNDLVSVIVPSYNTKEYVGNIITSIGNQTYSNIEVIWVDDGSLDGTAEIAEGFLKSIKYPYRIVRNQNSGVANARNCGISLAEGEWVICVDSDDYINPQMIEKLRDAANVYGVECVFCDYKEVDIENLNGKEEYDKGAELIQKEQMIYRSLCRDVRWVIPATLIRASVAKKLKFDVECPYSEDTLYNWNLICQLNSVVNIRSDMYNYLRRVGSKQHSLSVDDCLSSIERYRVFVERLKKENTMKGNFKYVLPKFILGAFHNLSKCVEYESYRFAYRQISKKDIFPLFGFLNARLFMYAFLFVSSGRIFYKVSRLI